MDLPNAPRTIGRSDDDPGASPPRFDGPARRAPEATPEIIRRVSAYNDGVDAFLVLVARAREALSFELRVPADVRDALAEAASQLLDERARLSGR